MPPFQALSESNASIIVSLSAFAPRLTLPVIEEPALSISLSDPEPVVMAAVIAVPVAVRLSLPSRLLLSLPREIV